MKILILGGSSSQKSLFESSKKLGLETILCDYDNEAVCRDIADKFYEVSITNREEVLEVAKKENIDGIVGNSESVITVCTSVANELNLPSNELKSIEILSNKGEFRKFQEENGFFTSKSLTLYPKNYSFEKISELKLPIIVKPIGSSGSRGIERIDVISDIENAISKAAEHSRCGRIIIEEYIDKKQDEYIIEADVFVQNSEVITWSIMSSIRDENANINIPIGGAHPSFLDEKRSEIFETEINRVFDLLDIERGGFNIEAVFDSENRLFIIEINARTGGTTIPELIKMSSGVDLHMFNVKASLDIPIKEEEYKDLSVKPMCDYLIHSDKSGEFNSIEVDKSILANIVELETYVKKGDNVNALSSADDVVGSAILEFDSVKQMKKEVDNLNKKITVKLM